MMNREHQTILVEKRNTWILEKRKLIPPAQSSFPKEVDVVVLGSGVAGLTAALATSLAGLSVIILEHMSEIGGTSARSSGTVWIPGNHLMAPGDAADDRRAASRYLNALVGNRGEPQMWRRYLDSAPEMLAELEEKADIRFRPYTIAPDYRQDCPGAAGGGRPLEPLPFDGRKLGSDFERLSWPLPELMVFGRMMVTRGEATELLRAHRSPHGFFLGFRLLARYLLDRTSHSRGTRLVLGNALVARLLMALIGRQVPVVTDVRCTQLFQSKERISGVQLFHMEREFTVKACRGVILAGGGFPASRKWRAENLPEPVAEHTPAHAGCDGSTLELALEIGAALGEPGLDNAFWFPSSIAKRRDGSTAVYPHIVLDRAKPGLIAVDAEGNRFVNEAVSYHEFVRAMNGKDNRCPAWLVCDRRFIRRYGLGMIRPRTPSLRKYVESGYLRTGLTIRALADQIGVPPEGLERTVSRYNGFANTGIDEEFGKGENIYDRSNGDPAIKPNPCVGPVGDPPYFALPVLPTPLGTSRGLRVDADARVCDGAGRPVPGLYACGNDMQSAFGGEYPGAGAQLGQAMTFAWIAARDLARGGHHRNLTNGCAQKRGKSQHDPT